MAIVNIPFELNRKPGILMVWYEPNQSAEKSGFDLFAGSSFDINMCIGYPTMHARIKSYEGSGYYTACAWIQIVTRREFASLEANEPQNIEASVDTHPTLARLGVPFFAFGFPPIIFDAPCNNLAALAKLEWIADTFLVTLPSRANDDTISHVAGFRWGYIEYDLDGKRQVEVSPLAATDPAAWNQQVPLLRSDFKQWKFSKIHSATRRSE